VQILYSIDFKFIFDLNELSFPPRLLFLHLLWVQQSNPRAEVKGQKQMSEETMPGEITDERNLNQY